MSAESFSRLAIFRRAPLNIAQVANLRAGFDQHECPLIEREHEHHSLSFPVLRNRLPNLGRHSALKWRVHIIRLAPLDLQTVESLGLRERARVKIKIEFELKLSHQLRWRQPVVPTVSRIS